MIIIIKTCQGPHLEERQRSYQYFDFVQGIPCGAPPQVRRPGPWRGGETQGSAARPPSLGLGSTALGGEIFCHSRKFVKEFATSR